MPAIQLARLKIQSVRLAENFADPQAFVHELHGLLDFYADRTRRPGMAGEPSPLLPAYNVPPQVIRQVERELAPFAIQDTQAALALGDRLWSEDCLECRLLAIALLGMVPSTPAGPVLERAGAWAMQETDARLLKTLFATGLQRLRQEDPDRYLVQISEWINSEQLFTQGLGLQAILPLVASQEFSNVPAIFRLITSLVRSAPVRLRPDLVDILRHLSQRSPQETVFFLRQNLAIKTDNPGTAWLARKCLSALPPESQASLRSALREHWGFSQSK
jgi:hypothetical protein